MEIQQAQAIAMVEEAEQNEEEISGGYIAIGRHPEKRAIWNRALITFLITL